jgi:hypothetical protein
MSIDYEVGLSCQVKERFGRETLLGLLKGRNQALASIQLAQADGDGHSAGDIRFGRTVLRGESGRTSLSPIEDVSAQQLLDAAAVLDAYAPRCVDCPANVGRRPFGCMQAIPYPITGVAETWLLDRLPTELAGPAGKMLRSAISDMKYGGRMIGEMRAAGPTFFERRAPSSRSWGRGLFRYSITSDQLLEMMVGLGEPSWSHCFMLTVFLGIVPFDVPPDQWREESTQRLAVNRAAMLMDLSEPSVHAWAVFLRGVSIASTFAARLWIDT